MLTITITDVPPHVFAAIASSGTRRNITVDEEALRILVRVFGRGLRQSQIDWSEKAVKDPRFSPPRIRGSAIALLRTLRHDRDQQVINQLGQRE